MYGSNLLNFPTDTDLFMCFWDSSKAVKFLLMVNIFLSLSKRNELHPFPVNLIFHKEFWIRSRIRIHFKLLKEQENAALLIFCYDCCPFNLSAFLRWLFLCWGLYWHAESLHTILLCTDRNESQPISLTPIIIKVSSHGLRVIKINLHIPFKYIQT